MNMAQIGATVLALLGISQVAHGQLVLLGNVHRHKVIHPGDADFSGRSGTSFNSISYSFYPGSNFNVGSSWTQSFADPGPWTNPQGSTIGDAAYLAASISSTGILYSYNIQPVPPSPQTRLQYGYDFTPRVTEGTDGYNHLNFVIPQFSSSIAGSLLELEIEIDGQWNLGDTGTQGLARTLLVTEPALPWNIEEDFVYHADTNTTRFYASRLSTGTGAFEGLMVTGYLIGEPVPSASGLATMAVCGMLGLRRRC